MKTILSLVLSLLCTFAYADTVCKISQEKAWEIVKQNVLGNKTENINVYVNTSVISAKTHIKTLGREEEVSPDTNSWLFFIDDIPYGNWSHPCRYIYVDCENSEVVVHNHSMPPLGIEMTPLIEQKYDTEVLLYDSKKMKEQSTKTIVTNNTLKNYAASKDYAVIINGGVKDSLNYIRYWNDCAAIYSTLVNVYGYNRNHIYVLMSDGTNPAYDRRTNYGFDSSPLDLDGDGTNDIQYAATRNNVISVLNQLSNTLTSDNNLFIYTMDHGGISDNNSYICLWNNEVLFDYEFASLLSNINANAINICMGQCHSGGFIDNLSNNKYVIATACKFNEVSHSLYNGCDGYDAFVYYWTAAVTGAYPNGVAANADSNSDGYISMREAFDFASTIDPEDETPQIAYTPSGTDTRLNLFMEIPDIIAGDVLISTYKIYNIPNLPSGVAVEWNLSDNYYNQNCLQQNYPSPNECKITRDNNHDMIYKKLTATIKYNGVAVDTLTKNICAYAGFKGTYISSFGSGVFSAPNPILTEPNTYVHLLSPSFIGATYSYTGDATPTYWLPGYDMLDVGMPSTGSTILIHIYCANGEDFYLPIIKYDNPYNLSIVFDGDIMTITLDESVSEEQAWTFELFNMVNGEKAITQNVSGNSISLNTSGWKRGLYAIRATIDKEVLIEKVVVK